MIESNLFKLLTRGAPFFVALAFVPGCPTNTMGDGLCRYALVESKCRIAESTCQVELEKDPRFDNDKRYSGRSEDAAYIGEDSRCYIEVIDADANETVIFDVGEAIDAAGDDGDSDEEQAQIDELFENTGSENA
jgi:hypothetical protein